MTNLSGNAKPHYVDTFSFKALKIILGLVLCGFCNFVPRMSFRHMYKQQIYKTFGAVRAVLRLYQEKTHRNTRHAAHAHAHAH